MMPKFRRNNIQDAQAMVEFALVLPILLLVIFGIFAFGHLFFTYSLVVAASREAARAGSAVGLSDNNLPRYRDCDDIRAAGVRVGGIAGVTADNIVVEYDKGIRPDGSVTMHPDGCPAGGIGPGYVQLGDRIVVTVTVNYRPIVPIIQLDEFPLTAETRRTIIIGMPVGEVTPSAPLCSGIIVRILPTNGQSFDNITVGEPFSAQMEVISDDPAIPAQGTVYLYYNDPAYATAVCSGSASGIVNCSAVWNQTLYDIPVVPIVGTETPTPTPSFMLRAKYDPGAHVPPAIPCFNPALAEPVVVHLIPSPTVTTIIQIDIVHTQEGDRARVTITVIPDAPGGGVPIGPVLVTTNRNSNNCTAMMTDAGSFATGSCNLEIEYGNNTITGLYNPTANPTYNRNYLSSTAQATFVYNTPTPTPTPTIRTPEPSNTPTKTPETPEPPAIPTDAPTKEVTP